MGRPREFDEDVVIGRARDAFWGQGIAATSVSDLSDATGLSTGSIYKAFESKDALQFRTLDDYLDRAVVEVADVLSAGTSPLAGIEAWLEGAVARASASEPTRGCYAVVCATELAETSPKVAERLRRHDAEMRRLLAAAIGAAVDAGVLAADPDTGARLLLTTVNGLQVEARKGVNADDARRTLRLALDALR